MNNKKDHTNGLNARPLRPGEGRGEGGLPKDKAPSPYPLPRGEGYWQSLDELAQTEALQQLVRQESPASADVWPENPDRRKFLALMGASLALAGINGCSVKPAPTGTIMPYVKSPEEVVPGNPLFFATTMVHGGDAVGLLVETHEGRPTKIEGNPDHPASRGATDIFHQASILTLYDPARSQTVVNKGQIRGWDDADAAIARTMSDQGNRRGAGLRLLTETIVSPTLGRQIDGLLKQFPDAKWHQYEPINDDMAFRAAVIAFGQQYQPVHDFGKADAVLSLDADFLNVGAGHVHYAGDFVARRRVRTGEADAASAEMNRLYVVETNVSGTGVKADHRLAVVPSEIREMARALAAELGVITGAGGSHRHQKWIAAVAKDLRAHSGRCLVLAGQRQPPEVHLLAHAMNHQLGNVGQTVIYTKPVESRPVDQTGSLRGLVDDMRAGRVEVLFILSGNPVYTAPADLEFAELIQKVPHCFHLSLFQNETSRLCEWHLPEAHYLEAWSDARAFNGTASIAQPMIEPLYHGRSAHELVAAISGTSERGGRQLVQSYWRQHWESSGRPGGNFEDFWETSLHDGVVRDTAYSAETVELQNGWQSRLQAEKAAGGAVNPAGLELALQSDPTIYDGRWATNGWLQELPKPTSKLAWDNAAIMSPTTAQQFGLALGSLAHGGEHGGYDVPMVALQVVGRRASVPIWIVPGHADGAITIYLGHGRQYAGMVADEWQQTSGFDAYPLRSLDRLWFATGVEMEKLDAAYPIACTQNHYTLGQREVIHAGTLSDYRQAPHRIAEPHGEHSEPPPTMYESYDYAPPQRKWGMSIDLTACIGCNACVVACQAENNIPVVGKEQVRRGREMHWIRVDRYIHGDPSAPDGFYFQPVPCMHCEHAPCEYVCPVAATVHSAEGLNDMIYNRCVGTRFCSNNCPYKVRRFNFFAYGDFRTMPRRLQYNPDVTVRSRGVMEKCTYCVQRIRHAEINAEAAGRPIRDGEVLTACQAACPTQAIVFGDINDDQSAVRECKDSPLDYGLLAELNTYPRTSYLAALRNPNPELEQ